MRPLLVLALLALAACGADGAPLRPRGSAESGTSPPGAVGAEAFSLGLSL